MNDSTTPPQNSKPSALFDQLLNRIGSDSGYSLLYRHAHDLSFGETDPIILLRKLQAENKRLKAENADLKALLRGRPKSKQRNCSVYIIAADTNEYKIGISEKPVRRLSEIASTLRLDVSTLKIIHQQETTRRNAFKVEHQLHMEFSDCRVHGEWFTLSEDDLKKAISRCLELIG